jgi:hypothetical protein
MNISPQIHYALREAVSDDQERVDRVFMRHTKLKPMTLVVQGVYNPSIRFLLIDTIKASIEVQIKR